MDEKNYTIADVAKICKLPDSTVRGIITRKQKSTALEVAFKLSDGLNVSLRRLNGMPETPTKNEPATTQSDSELDDLDKLLMDFVHRLTADQKKLLLAQLKLMLETQ